MSLQERERIADEPSDASHPPGRVADAPSAPERAGGCEVAAAPRSRLLTVLLAILPLAALALVIWIFARTNAGLNVAPPAPIEVLTIERTVMDKAGFHISVRNESPADVEITQVVVNDAIWAMSVEPAPSIPRLRSATVHIPYPWVLGEAYAIALFSANAIVTPVEVPVAFETPKPQAATVWSFALIGTYVGIIPIFLGLLWLPVLRSITRPWWVVLLAATAGILVYLGIDSLAEAIEQAGVIGGAFQGVGLAGIGLVGTVLLLEALSKLKTARQSGEAEGRLSLAFMIALGIGVHNLGEGLAIGAAFNIGEAALGAFLVIGFILQNITEGLGIIAPIVRDRPAVGALVKMGLVAGAPAIVGCWIGGFTYLRPLSVLFLGIGAGAVFQVAAEIGRLLRRDLAEPRGPMLAFAGAMAGMLALYVTGLLIK